jgi:glycosyltransferase involved in cell wall biosynthesis
MHIGVDALFEDERDGTGGLTYLRGLLSALPATAPNDEFVVFTRHAKSFRLDSSATPSNVRVQPCSIANYGAVPRLVAQHAVVPLLASRLKVDVLLCPGNIAPLFGRVPTVVVCQNHTLLLSSYSAKAWHHPVGFWRTSYRAAVGRRSLAKAAAIVAVSQHLADVLIGEGVPRSKVRVIGLGVDPGLSNGEPHPARPSGHGYVLNVGRLLPGKNQEMVIRAFAAYARRSGDVTRALWIVGSDFNGRSRVLRAVAAAEGIADRVIIRDFVPFEEMKAIYAGAALSIQISHEEAYALPSLEAMALGIPVVASRTSAFPEVIGPDGILVAPDNCGEIAGAIHRVLHDHALHADLIARGRQRAEQFSWRKSAQQIMNVLRASAAQTACRSVA